VVGCLYYAGIGSWVVVKNRTGRGRQCTIGRGTSGSVGIAVLTFIVKSYFACIFVEILNSVGHSVGCGSGLGEGFYCGRR